MNPDLPTNRNKKPIGILTNDYDYAESWLFENRNLDHIDSNNRIYEDVTGQRYVIRNEARKLLGYELLTVFVLCNPARMGPSVDEINLAKSRIR